MTRVAQIAEWAAALSLADVPGRVVELCRSQRRSVLAAVAASTGDPASRRVLAAVDTWAADGPAPVPGLPRPLRVDDALYAMAALSIALDFDDYVCFGHTGHSAVLTPLLLAAETGASGADQLTAQVAANEVEARLGGACLVGPLNGQLWSFIHAAGAALAAGRLFGLDASTLAHALAIALYEAPRPTVPGFMAPDSKLLTAAEPLVLGVRAARLAAAGVTGPLDVLDHREGFLAAFAHAPLPAMLDGLGRAWATDTLCVKPYPGCAYVDTAVDAVLSLGPVGTDNVDRIEVDASMLTCEMNHMSSRYAQGPPTPVTINFSLAWNVAIALVAGELSPRVLRPDWLAGNHDELRRLADRVVLRHDPALTRRAADEFGRLLPPGSVVRDAGWAGLLSGAWQLRGRQSSLRSGDVRDIGRFLRGSARPRSRPSGFWDPDAINGFEMTFPARVRVVGRSGDVRTAEASVPVGGAGNAERPPDAVSREKLAASGPPVWGDDGTAAIATAIDADDAELWRYVSARRTSASVA